MKKTIMKKTKKHYDTPKAKVVELEQTVMVTGSNMLMDYDDTTYNDLFNEQ